MDILWIFCGLVDAILCMCGYSVDFLWISKQHPLVDGELSVDWWIPVLPGQVHPDILCPTDLIQTCQSLKYRPSDRLQNSGQTFIKFSIKLVNAIPPESDNLPPFHFSLQY